MTSIPRCDNHMHTKHLGCANGTMVVAAMTAECARMGVTQMGITDHMNSLDRLPLHREIRKDIEALDAPVDVYFGVELNYIEADGAFAFSPEIKEEYGFQFAIGGIHQTYLKTYDLKALVDVQHRHHLRTCRDPLVDVLVHPYWFGKGEFDRNGWPWFDSMRAVPASYARELGQVARDTGTAIEINACANLENSTYGDRFAKEYVEYLALVAAEGASFSLGSDAHDVGQLRAIQRSWQVAEQLKLPPERVWRPEGRPMVGPGAKR